MVSKREKTLLKSFGLFLFILGAMILVPLTIGLSKGGFEVDQLFKRWVFYIGPGIGFMIGLLIALGVGAIIEKGDDKYGDSIAFVSPGEAPSPSFFNRYSLTQLAWLSSIVFPALALLNFIVTGQSFTGVGTLPQQFTAIDSALFSSGLIPAAENAGLAFVIAISLVGLRYLARKNNWNRNAYIGLAWSVILIGATYGLLNHLSRYGAQELSLFVVFMFWGLGTVLTLLTGTFIPFWFMHIANNFFIDISRIFSSDILTIYSIIALILWGIIYIVVYRKDLAWIKGVNAV